MVGFLVAHHRKWRGLRASLRSLAATDAHARELQAGFRRAQLHRMQGVGRAPQT